MKYRSLIAADGLELPVDIVLERRRDTRYGIRGARITLRLPHGSPPEYVHLHLIELQQWVQQQFERRPVLRAPFQQKEYRTGDVLTVGKRRYWLEVDFEDRATHTARLIGGTIHLQLSSRSTDAHHRQRSIKTLLSRVVAEDFYPEIADRVHDINRLTVNQTIRNISLKYNHSNWGSCSSHGNVNLSTRLLFAPDDVQNYVILHELAHLVELNHSDRFWALVARFMPEYREKERWLKLHRTACDF